MAPLTTHADVDPLGRLDQTVVNGDKASYRDVRLSSIVGTVISTFLSILGALFLVLTIYGGFIWMSAQGAEEEVTKAKKIITQAVIGLAIVMAAYAISYFVTSNIQKATTAENPTSGIDYPDLAGAANG